MKRQLLLATAALALLLPASVGQSQQNAAEPAAVAEPTATMTSDDFIQKATISNLFQVQASEAALQKSQNEAVKKLAQQLVTDQKKANDQIAALLKKEKIEATVPTALDDTHQKMLDDLNAASAEEFDKIYLEAQMKAHEDATALLNGYWKGGDNEKLQALAKGMRPTVQWHVDMMQKMDAGA